MMITEEWLFHKDKFQFQRPTAAQCLSALSVPTPHSTLARAQNAGGKFKVLGNPGVWDPECEAQHVFLLCCTTRLEMIYRNWLVIAL
jgi:hypothetical protein